MKSLTIAPQAQTPEVMNDDDSAPTQTVGHAIATTREAQKVQAAMAVAKRFPRDQVAASRRIVESCKRPGLAAKGMYAFPRGGKPVTGPSIRLAEEMARQWGNLDMGVHELERTDGESVMEAYCWDLETNARVTKQFTVKHVRDTKEGGKALKDERDIYEIGANMGARRLRACILSIIPADVTEEAVAQVKITQAGGSDRPIIDRIKAMVDAFAELGVAQALIEKKMGMRVDQILEPQLVDLRAIYTTIKDGQGRIEDWFEVARSEKGPAVDLNAKLDAAAKTAEPAKEPTPAAKPTPAPKAAPKVAAAPFKLQFMPMANLTVAEAAAKFGDNALEEHFANLLEKANAGDIQAKSECDAISAYFQGQQAKS